MTPISKYYIEYWRKLQIIIGFQPAFNKSIFARLKDAALRRGRTVGAIVIAMGCIMTSVQAESLTETLRGRHVVGYQGWFTCPTAGSPDPWRHWTRGGAPSHDSLTVDMWPDTSGYSDDELCRTTLETDSGSKSFLFSSTSQKTVDRHLLWMKQYNIDGLALQRFLVELKDESRKATVDKVLNNIRSSAKKFGRGWYIMYDISGGNSETWAKDLLEDWTQLVASGITKDPTYWHHDGHPVLSIWGVGFKDRPGNPEEVLRLQNSIRKANAGITLIGGVPAGWRTSSADAKQGSLWAEVYKGFDVISPWNVGRFQDKDSWQVYLSGLQSDYAETKSRQQEYMPVIFPGYSFSNGGGSAKLFDLIPRRCGAFYKMQIDDILKHKVADMLYTAMFDEVDEGTAIMPTASIKKIPRGERLVSSANGDCQLPSSAYLEIAGDATSRLRALAGRP